MHLLAGFINLHHSLALALKAQQDGIDQAGKRQMGINKVLEITWTLSGDEHQMSNNDVWEISSLRESDDSVR